MRPSQLLPLALLALAAPARAADLVLTDFTPASFDDFSVAQDLGHLFRMALEGEGLDVLAGEELMDVVGDDADTCIEEPGCPTNLWDRVDSDVVLASRVEREDGLLRIQVQVWDRGKASPSFIYEEVVSPGHAGEYLLGIAANLAPDRGEAPVVTRVAPGVVEEAYAPIGEDPGRGGSQEAQPEPALRVSDLTADADLGELDLPGYAQRAYADSAMPLDQWLQTARVRTRAVFVELHVGAVMGDLDRRFDTRVSLYDEVGSATSERDTYTYETFLNGQGFTGGLAVGYQVAWWIDLSVLGAAQLSRKELTTGWETWEAGAADDGSDLYITEDSTTWEPVPAVLGQMQPRVRLYPLATGLVKPYGLVGLDLRFYDAYSVPADEITEYPEAQGGVGLGPTIGGGLAIDVDSNFVGFLEVPWTYVLMPSGPQQTGGSLLASMPQQFRGVGQYLAFEAGLAYHFR